MTEPRTPPARASRDRPRTSRPDGRATPAEVVQYALVRAVGFVLRRMPVEWASASIGGALRVIMPLTSRHRRALEHLVLALPETTPAERERIARAMWMHLGRVAGEAFQIDRLIDDPARVTLPDDFERFQAIGGGGAISATLHLGNWEIAGAVPRRGGVPLAGVYQALHNPLVDRYLRSRRMGAYPAGLFTKGPRLGNTLIGLARSGAAVGIVADLREKRGVGVMFFGHPAFATPLPAMLARATGKPLIAGAVMRTKGVRFRVLMEHVPVPVTDDRQRDVEEATQALHDVFERWIREAPEQWMWTHRKWARSSTRALTVREVLFPDDADGGADAAGNGLPSPPER